MTHPFIKTLLAAAVSMVLLVGCSSSDSDSADDPTPAASGDDSPSGPGGEVPLDPGSGGGSDNPGSASSITSANAEALIGTVFDVYAGEDYRVPLFGMIAFGEFIFSEDPAESVAAFGPGFIAPLTFASGPSRDAGSIVCENGGTLGYSFDLTVPNLFDYDFDNCQAGATVIDGVLTGRQGASRGTNDEARGTDLTIQRANDTLTLNGGVNAFGSEIEALAYRFDGELSYPLDDGVLELVSDGFSLSCGFGYVEDGRNPPMFQSVLDGSFVISSPATGGETLTITTDEPFSYFADGDGQSSTLGDDERFIYVRGRMTVVATDGSQAVLSADNGDERTFELTVSSSDGTETLTIPAAALMDRTHCSNR